MALKPTGDHRPGAVNGKPVIHNVYTVNSGGLVGVAHAGYSLIEHHRSRTWKLKQKQKIDMLV